MYGMGKQQAANAKAVPNLTNTIAPSGEMATAHTAPLKINKSISAESSLNQIKCPECPKAYQRLAQLYDHAIESHYSNSLKKRCAIYIEDGKCKICGTALAKNSYLYHIGKLHKHVIDFMSEENKNNFKELDKAHASRSSKNEIQAIERSRLSTIKVNKNEGITAPIGLKSKSTPNNDNDKTPGSRTNEGQKIIRGTGSDKPSKSQQSLGNESKDRFSAIQSTNLNSGELKSKKHDVKPSSTGKYFENIKKTTTSTKLQNSENTKQSRTYKPYQCEKCDFQATEKSILKSHMRDVHKIKDILYIKHRPYKPINSQTSTISETTKNEEKNEGCNHLNVFKEGSTCFRCNMGNSSKIPALSNKRNAVSNSYLSKRPRTQN